MDTHLSFSLARTELRSRILIPKYYDPDLELAAKRAAENCDLRKLGDLLLPGAAGSRLGDWVEREHYGTGRIPYVRTSDLSHWRIRPDHKKSLSEHIYEQYRERQDIRQNDLLMVAHGTYLVGNTALVTEEDPKLVLQDHVFRLRVNPHSGVSPHYLLAALSTSFVKRQVRARQFSADIIDKLGERHLELQIPIPRDPKTMSEISRKVKRVISNQSALRGRFRALSGSDLRMTPERAATRYGFSLSRKEIRSRILIPKYYDPTIVTSLRELQSKDDVSWLALGDLEKAGLLLITNGVEVGKMAYGTGAIPFIRTSDIIDQQIKLEVRHGVSDKVYDAFKAKAALEPGDVLLVRDGTYLVGSSAIVTSEDLPALTCGGIQRLRSLDPTRLSPFWLLAVLNFPIVRRQLRARQFTRDVIDTLGTRLLEIQVPNPFTSNANQIAKQMAPIVAAHQKVRTEIQNLVEEIEPEPPPILSGRPSWSMR
jgi:hypothetical protein